MDSNTKNSSYYSSSSSLEVEIISQCNKKEEEQKDGGKVVCGLAIYAGDVGSGVGRRRRR